MSVSVPWYSSTRSIYAIGRNYAAHAAELNNVIPKEPFWFLCPYSSLLDAGLKPGCSPAIHRCFPGRSETHHELELGILIRERATAVKLADFNENESEFLERFVAGYFISLDMTDRAGQSVVKQEGKPWTQCKGWDTSCPVGAFKPLSEFGGPEESTSNLAWRNLDLWLKVNGELKQSGHAGNMLVGVPKLIEAVSRVHTLMPGDMILTGTPEGVGAAKPGDIIEAGIHGFPDLDLKIKVVLTE